MDTAVDPGRTFWTQVLAAGGVTTLPRWARAPVPGVGVVTRTVPADVTTALRRRAGELAVPLTTLALAAHAVVLARLSGDREVTTGYSPGPGGRPLPCRLTTEPASWGDLVTTVADAEASLLAHRDVPVEELARELGLAGPSFETVFAPGGDVDPLPAGAVLGVAVDDGEGGLTLTVRHRTDLVDAEFAARTAGYHLAALTALAADPDADPAGQDLLSAEERRVQLEDLAGRPRALPDARVHELVEQRASAHPDAIAAVHRGRQWTYGELDARANRLAHALRARGLDREDVVGVVLERDLDWLAAVLAVFKAGGVYLPIEPHFPADRIATTLSRAGCRLVLTEAGSTGTLDPAIERLAGVERVLVDDAWAEGHAEHGLGIAVAPDQLAYIYFTSGSTGEPKGAMCEHAGLVNHLFAKIDDLEIGPGQVVAQTAPQCFDISLWQLVSALLVGGRTVLVEQQVVLDVERFVDTLVDSRVTVLQVVPSYLDVVLAYLEAHPRPLPDLRYVSVTGEAVKKELVQRWFTAQPGIRLVNAYGLTETSDDTNHEVLDRVPDHDRVPLGRPISNVRVLVVDEQLAPVPLGAPGEIVFSGVCVGRGYVNDPERTRAAFPPDPYSPGGRLYRSGDHGRWLPDGKLEFLGRRDTQVKVSGFRIEIGEVENTLLRVPGVRDGAVVVAGAAGAAQYLVAFYTAAGPVDDQELRDRLSASLPAYMVPTAFHWRRALPLTANSKIDRRALTALAATLAVEEQRAAPRTPAEVRLASAWAAVLGIPADRIGRQDSFFDLGGTSLSAVKLAVALHRAVTPTDVAGHPVLADLAALLTGRP
ncbi:non-ribosomal peptide synthetase [Blastococcus sp. TF02-09]|uniref:non-ribosomal peptide synthetase n=1 Tax=Blastococcus sp. TF02-09 TaxID=2250576 RepID=UPI000DE9080A|nr:non-ribosomal peptide synthetase [Blastococcus sp. TF02-9]RBY79058.1 non-ribosomal peptide synthetase [Blastococcus sp. TF02-9]